MQLDHIGATTFDSPGMSAPEATASARGRLGRFWAWSMGCIARYRARHQRVALDEHMLRDVGQTRADAPPWMDPQTFSRMSAEAWGWNMGTVTGGSARACDFH